MKFLSSSVFRRLFGVIASLTTAWEIRAQSASASQVAPLITGWNLVSIQVGNPVPPDRLQQDWGSVPSGNPALCDFFHVQPDDLS